MNSSICKRINKLKEKLQEKKFTIKDVILQSALKNAPQDGSMQYVDVLEGVIFDIVIKAEGEDIGTEYERYKEMPMFFCRCIGGKIEGSSPRETVTKIYCMIGIPEMEMDGTYLHCMINEYFKVISAWVSVLVNAVGVEDSFNVSDILRNMEADINEFYDGIPEGFRKHMLEVYGIDINVIIGLSGSYYENGQCDSGIFFDISDDNLKVKGDAVLLKEPVEVKAVNIRIIRKLLEMGNARQYLVARKRKNSDWEIVGLCSKDNIHRGIAFRIIRHMVWYMEVAGKKAVYYKCGRYALECEEFTKREFKAKYKKVFNKECSKDLMEILEGAMVQEHGTVVVILDHNHLYSEVKRLLTVSTGIEVEGITLKAEYIHNITTIDGAVIFDESGICYAIGVILDGSASIEGNPERGARFNSTLNYVKTCEKSGKRALALVVSEDRNVDILATVM